MTESVTPSPIQEPVSVDDNSGSLTVDLNQTADGNAVDVLTIAAGDNNIGNVDVVTMPTTTVQATNLDIRDLTQASDSVAVGDGTTAVEVVATQADNLANTTNGLGASAMGYVFDGSTWDRQRGDSTDGTLVNLGTNNDVVEASASGILTAVQIMDDWDESDRAKVNPIVGQAGVQGGSGAVSSTTQRVVLATDVALPAGTALIGAVTPRPETTGGLTIFRSLDLDETEEEIKASAGQVYGWFIANTATSTRFVKFYNATAANVTVGSTTPVLTLPIPGNSSDDIAANALGGLGITFDTAITVAATTGVADADTGAPAANDVIINVFYK